jgi:L-asparaginase
MEESGHSRYAGNYRKAEAPEIMARKRSILLITTGGTFGMLPDARGFLRGVVKAVPEVTRLARISAVAPFALDSSSMVPAHWTVLARLIAERMEEFDGFVVTHGTDTMAYTAAALSFLLENLRKPVILTGAQRPLLGIRTDARANLVDAVEVATQDLPEVAIGFGGLVLRGNRSRKWSLSDMRAFQSPNYPPLGEVGARLVLHHDRIRKPAGRFRLRPELDPCVLHLRRAPGLVGSSLTGLDLDSVHGVVLEAFGAGNVPLLDGREVFPLGAFAERGIPVVVVAGAEHGSVDFSLYDGGRRAARDGAIPARDMTAEAAVVKLMAALARARGRGDVRKLFERDWAGEVSLA